MSTAFANVILPSSQPIELTEDTLGRAEHRDARIAIVDDEELNVEVVLGYLEDEGYRKFEPTTDPCTALAMIRSKMPDVVLLDLKMPVVSGFDILSALRADEALRRIPVIMLTASTEPELKLKALRLGANEFLAKPIDASELLVRLANVLSVKVYQDQLVRQSAQLEQQVRTRTAQLEQSRQHIVHCLARASEFRDDDTGQHVKRVGCYAAVIAAELGFDETFVARIQQAAQLHDIGKIGIPDAILLKPGKLDPDEFALMKTHCGLGRSIVQARSEDDTGRYRQHADVGALLLEGTNSELIDMAATIAQTHHEKWDGSGYPLGLKGDDIPIEGRITAVADVFDALSSRRTYKPAFDREKCFAILEEGRGKHFDPEVLKAFFARSEEIIRVQIRHADVPSLAEASNLSTL